MLAPKPKTEGIPEIMVCRFLRFMWSFGSLSIPVVSGPPVDRSRDFSRLSVVVMMAKVWLPVLIQLVTTLAPPRGPFRPYWRSYLHFIEALSRS